jgi:hypothetical protein
MCARNTVSFNSNQRRNKKLLGSMCCQRSFKCQTAVTVTYQVEHKVKISILLHSPVLQPSLSTHHPINPPNPPIYRPTTPRPHTPRHYTPAPSYQLRFRCYTVVISSVWGPQKDFPHYQISIYTNSQALAGQQNFSLSNIPLRKLVFTFKRTDSTSHKDSR